MTVDVVPKGDLVRHTESDDCVCGPLNEPVKLVNGGIGWVRTHHSLDNREQEERTQQ